MPPDVPTREAPRPARAALAPIDSVAAARPAPLPDGFVRLRDVAPAVAEEMRYHTAFNVVGEPAGHDIAHEDRRQHAAVALDEREAARTEHLDRADGPLRRARPVDVAGADDRRPDAARGVRGHDEALGLDLGVGARVARRAHRSVLADAVGEGAAVDDDRRHVEQPPDA